MYRCMDMSVSIEKSYSSYMSYLECMDHTSQGGALRAANGHCVAICTRQKVMTARKHWMHQKHTTRLKTEGEYESARIQQLIHRPQSTMKYRHVSASKH